MDTRVALVSAPGAIGLETRELRPPGAGEAIVRVAECGLCGSDLKLYSGGHPKLQPPLRLGPEVHGTASAAHGPAARRGPASPAPRGAADGRGPGGSCPVSPPIGCGQCRNCRRGEPHICSAMTFV